MFSTRLFAPGSRLSPCACGGTFRCSIRRPILIPRCSVPNVERRAGVKKEVHSAQPKTPQWDVDTFVKTCVSDEGQVKDRLLDIAMHNGISKARARELLSMAECEKRIHRWVSGPNKPVRFATGMQPLIETSKARRSRKSR